MNIKNKFHWLKLISGIQNSTIMYLHEHYIAWRIAYPKKMSSVQNSTYESLQIYFAKKVFL